MAAKTAFGKHTAAAPSRGPVGTAASARRSSARPRVRAWSSPVRRGTCSCRSSTTPWATRWRQRLHHGRRPAHADGDKTDKAKQGRRAPRQRAKAAGITRGRVRPWRQPLRTAASRRSRTAPARAGSSSGELATQRHEQLRRGTTDGWQLRVAVAAPAASGVTVVVTTAAAAPPTRASRTSSAS